jgi:glycosyltransferase involved in cell wall biosynthesis
LVRNIGLLPDDVDIVFAGGGGPLERALEKYVSSHGLGERVRIMGSVTPAKWSQLFAQAALVVMPSLWNEPLGLAGLYAMAHGKPVIAFRSSGIDEWLQSGQTGSAIPFGAREEFVKETVRPLNDGKNLAQLGRNALEAWNLRFRPEHHLASLRDYYSRLASGKTAGLL